MKGVGRGAVRVGSNYAAVFITLNNSLYASRLNSLWRNQLGISGSKNTVFGGSWILHIEFTVAANNRYIGVAHRKEIHLSV